MNEDLRVTKTKQNIQSHFLDLLQSIDFQNITIKLLIKECQINRSTFYRNYEDKYDLIQKIVQQLLNEFDKNIYPEFITLDKKKHEDFKPYFIPLINYFENNKKVLILLSKNSLPINIFNEMLILYSEKLFNELMQHYHIQTSQITIAHYFSQIIASNILTAMQWWHLKSPQTSKEDIINIITVTVTEGIFSSMQTQFQFK